MGGTNITWKQGYWKANGKQNQILQCENTHACPSYDYNKNSKKFNFLSQLLSQINKIAGEECEENKRYSPNCINILKSSTSKIIIEAVS